MASKQQAQQQQQQQNAAGRGGDTIGRLLEELCKPGTLERRRDGERHLQDYVDGEARDLSADAFGRLMQDIFRRIEAMMRPG